MDRLGADLKPHYLAVPSVPLDTPGFGHDLDHHHASATLALGLLEQDRNDGGVSWTSIRTHPGEERTVSVTVLWA
jgi:hypothetical protein